MDDQAVPQFSADGNYWWDGEQWLPVDQLSRQIAGTSDPGLPVLHDHRPSRRRLTVALVAGGLVAVLLVVVVLAAGGRIPALASRPGATGARSTPSPSASPSHSPSPSPTPGAMAGVTMQTILPIAKQQGLGCLNVTADLPGIAGFCQVSRHKVLKRIVAYGASSQHIERLRAVYERDDAAPDTAAAATFLAAVTALPYPGADPTQATAWVHAHLTDPSASTTIGTMTLGSRVEANGHRLIVDIVPA